MRRLLPLGVLLPTLVPAADVPLSRDPQTYLVLGMQRATVNPGTLHVAADGADDHVIEHDDVKPG